MKTITLTDEQAQFLTDAMNWWKTSGVNYWSQQNAVEILSELSGYNSYISEKYNIPTIKEYFSNQAKPPRGGLGQGGPLPTEEPSQGRQEKRK